ncbi:lipocalin-like domain-containing protein [Bacteroidota bacterium]
MKLIFILLSILMVFCAQEKKKNPVEGVWVITEIKTDGPDYNYFNPTPQPSLIIFTEKYYSMVWMPGDKPPVDNKKKWYPTDEEKINSFNSIIVNSGDYIIRDTTIITYPKVAKTNEFIGGSATYSFEFVDDTLLLKLLDTYSHDGVQDLEILKYRTSLKLLKVDN